MPSAKYSILSTKPLSREQVQQAAAQGIAVSEQAFIEVRPVADPEAGTAFKKGGTFVFTSPNTVKIIAEITENTGTVVPDGLSRHRNLIDVQPAKIYCIQGATRQAVEAQLPQAHIAGAAAHSKALAEQILQDGTISSVVFFCGNIRRDELPDMLRSHGVEVKEIIVYETLETPVQLTETYDGVLFYSPSSVRSFFSVNTLPARTVCFAIGHTTGAALREVTENKVLVSPEPAVDALLQTVILYFDNINSQE